MDILNWKAPHQLVGEAAEKLKKLKVDLEVVQRLPETARLSMAISDWFQDPLPLECEEIWEEYNVALIKAITEFSDSDPGSIRRLLNLLSSSKHQIPAETHQESKSEIDPTHAGQDGRKTSQQEADFFERDLHALCKPSSGTGVDFGVAPSESLR
jgi:hypothetical protein